MENTIKELKNKLDLKTRNNILEHHTHFSTSVDKYFRWVPLISVFAMDAAGLKSKNNLKQHLLIAITAEALLNAIVQPLKITTHELRPNASLKINSFPSNHAATSFLGAEILHQELKEKYPLWSYSGYIVAAATGVLRLYNNKHWLSDVAAGTLIGILSGKLTYWVFNKVKRKPAKDKVYQ